MNLNGKRIVLLGGTAGIGLATAAAAAREGAVVVVASSTQERVARAVADLPKGTEGYTIDLSNEEQIRDFFERIDDFDHLVFTAGEAIQANELDSIQIDQARQFFNLRFWGAFAAVKYGSSHIRPGGSIVLTTGIVGTRPRKGWTVGASISGAMESLTRALAVELAPIRVNAVSPGVVQTDLWRNMQNINRETMSKTVGASLPLGRVGEAEDLAQAYLYLMREDFSTGQTIVVDGGAVLV